MASRVALRMGFVMLAVAAGMGGADPRLFDPFGQVLAPSPSSPACKLDCLAPTLKLSGNCYASILANCMALDGNSFNWPDAAMSTYTPFTVNYEDYVIFYYNAASTHGVGYGSCSAFTAITGYQNSYILRPAAVSASGNSAASFTKATEVTFVDTFESGTPYSDCDLVQVTITILPPPTTSPTLLPTVAPIYSSPSLSPSEKPTVSPTCRPSSRAPITRAPVTKRPTLVTLPPLLFITKSPATTSEPTTAAPVTSVPSSSSPSAQPTTGEPTTSAPSSARPTSLSPVSSAPSSRSPSTTNSPTSRPTFSPSASPTATQTSAPTNRPTKVPSFSPSLAPSRSRPSVSPTRSPSLAPSPRPTNRPHSGPSAFPTTSTPSRSPSSTRPSQSPTTTKPTASPSHSPTTKIPSRSPSKSPSASPSHRPNFHPSSSPSQSPSQSPSHLPTYRPTHTPSHKQTLKPTSQSPTRRPSASPTARPIVTSTPSASPSEAPSTSPTNQPTSSPYSSEPSASPRRTPTLGNRPTKSPVKRPTFSPSHAKPTHSPIVSFPTVSPSVMPTYAPLVSAEELYAHNISIDMFGGYPFVFFYDVEAPNVRVMVKYSTQGWIGVGLSGPNPDINAMLGGIGVIGCSDPIKPAVGLYTLSSLSVSGVKLMPGSLASYGIYNASYQITSAGSTLKFLVDSSVGNGTFNLLPSLTRRRRRQLDLSGTANLSSSGSVNMIFAQGGRGAVTFDIHANQAVYSLTFLTPNGSGPAQNNVIVREMDNALFVHIVFMLAGFGFLLPTGAMFGYCHSKSKPGSRWFLIHRSMQILGGVVSVLGGICGFVHVANMGEDHITQSHHALGLAVLLGVVFQIINGLLRPHVSHAVALAARASKDFDSMSAVMMTELHSLAPLPPPPTPTRPGHTPKRRVWYVVHRVTALFVLIGSGVNILLGRNTLVDVFLGKQTSYAFLGTTYSVDPLVDLCYFVGAWVITWVAVGAIYSLILRDFMENMSADGLEKRWDSIRMTVKATVHDVSHRFSVDIHDVRRSWRISMGNPLYQKGEARLATLPENRDIREVEVGF